MTRRPRSVRIALALGLLAALASAGETASAADKTTVSQATKRVEQGARQIGQGQVGPGFRGMFTGIGQTIVAGARFSGENIKEFFSGKK